MTEAARNELLSNDVGDSFAVLAQSLVEGYLVAAEFIVFRCKSSDDKKLLRCTSYESFPRLLSIRNSYCMHKEKKLIWH